MQFPEFRHVGFPGGIHIAELEADGGLPVGLSRLELRCTFLDFVGGMAPQQAATMRASDLLFAVAFAEYTPAVVDIVQDVHLRGVPVLAITDVPESPLARYSSLSFLVDEADTHQFRPIAGAICLVQTLMIALGAGRERAEGLAPYS